MSGGECVGSGDRAGRAQDKGILVPFDMSLDCSPKSPGRQSRTQLLALTYGVSFPEEPDDERCMHGGYSDWEMRKRLWKDRRVQAHTDTYGQERAGYWTCSHRMENGANMNKEEDVMERAFKWR